MRGETVTVIGAGIIGLTAAVRLAEAGRSVGVVAHRSGGDSVSGVAGAIWLPYEARPWARVRLWAQATYGAYEAEIAAGVPGVGLSELWYLHDGREEVPGWVDIAPGVERRPAAAFAGGLPPGYPEAFVAAVPVVEPRPYLAHLAARFVEAGGTITWLDGPLRTLKGAPGTGPIVNCTGLAAGRLCGDDTVYPIRGQVVRVGRTTHRAAVAADYGPLALSYVIPRAGDTILGGTASYRDDDLTVRESDTRHIRDRCASMVPETADATALDVVVGLRPGRSEVRLEASAIPSGRQVVHCYGHGGSGYTLCWGCADDVCRLIGGTAD